MVFVVSCKLVIAALLQRTAEAVPPRDPPWWLVAAGLLLHPLSSWVLAPRPPALAFVLLLKPAPPYKYSGKEQTQEQRQIAKQAKLWEEVNLLETHTEIRRGQGQASLGANP